MDTNDCIFCKIVKGELHCTPIYEDGLTLAFLDIGPLVQGHTLVIPKTHVDPMMAATPETLSACMNTVRHIATLLTNNLKADGVNVHQANGKAAGQVVPHLHFHVIPRFDDDPHHWNWTPSSYENVEVMEQMAKTIKGMP